MELSPSTYCGVAHRANELCLDECLGSGPFFVSSGASFQRGTNFPPAAIVFFFFSSWFRLRLRSLIRPLQVLSGGGVSGRTDAVNSLQPQPPPAASNGHEEDKLWPPRSSGRTRPAGKAFLLCVSPSSLLAALIMRLGAAARSRNLVISWPSSPLFVFFLACLTAASRGHPLVSLGDEAQKAIVIDPRHL